MVQSKHKAPETTESKLVKIKDTTNDFLDGLGSFKITDKESFDTAAVHLETIGKMKKVITTFWAPLIKSAFNAKAAAATALRSVRDKEKECLVRCEKADVHFRKIRLAYKTAQDEIDRKERAKEEAKAEAAAKRESDKLLKKAEKTIEPAKQEKLIEKADEVKAVPVFIPKTVKKSERTESGTLNTFVPVVEIEVHDIKSICGMIFNGELAVNVVTVSEAKIKAWAKMMDKPAGMYDGFNINHTEKERITARKN
jgi:hypothetical protein